MDMFVFILGLLLVFGALAAYGVAASRKQAGIAGIATVILAIGAFTIIWDSWTQIPARNVGVVNTFGHANDHLDSGAHWVAPWSSVDQIDATVKTVKLTTDLARWAEGTCTAVTVRLANQTTACVDVTYQWNLSQTADVNDLWARYRGAKDELINNLQNNLVDPQMRSAASQVFVNYNPLAALDPTNRTVAPSTKVLGENILSTLKQLVPDSITVDSLLIPGLVHFDAVTQSKLNLYASALADTQIATQQKLTATQQALANAELARNASTDDPGVKFQNCLNLVASLAAKGYLKDLPVNALQCTTTSTGTAPVIVNGR